MPGLVYNSARPHPVLSIQLPGDDAAEDGISIALEQCRVGETPPAVEQNIAELSELVDEVSVQTQHLREADDAAHKLMSGLYPKQKDHTSRPDPTSSAFQERAKHLQWTLRRVTKVIQLTPVILRGTLTDQQRKRSYEGIFDYRAVFSKAIRKLSNLIWLALGGYRQLAALSAQMKYVSRETVTIDVLSGTFFLNSGDHEVDGAIDCINHTVRDLNELWEGVGGPSLAPRSSLKAGHALRLN